MLNFCTLFDHNYLSRGLILYESLTAHCSDDFTLYILATDDIAYNWFREKAYKNVIVQSLNDIKTAYPVLNRLQQERTRAEFSWTLSSFSIQFFLKKYNIESVTYIDSDICFYAYPKLLFDELNGESVIITPHNYTPKYDQTATSGRYCVQFMYFKNNKDGNEVLEWWRSACEECCCSVPKDGKFGDQKYLDDWLFRFPGKVHEEKYMGCGIAPWNIQQFDLECDDSGITVINKITKLYAQMVFYHFHGVRDYFSEKQGICWSLNSYELSESVIKNIYEPYFAKLRLYADKLPAGNEINISIINKELPVYIYGAGVLGVRCFMQLKNAGYKNMKAFIVTAKNNNPDTLMGLTVIPIEDLKDNLNTCEIIIAVKEVYKIEILNLLRDMNIGNIYYHSYTGKKIYYFDKINNSFSMAEA